MRFESARKGAREVLSYPILYLLPVGSIHERSARSSSAPGTRADDRKNDSRERDAWVWDREGKQREACLRVMLDGHGCGIWSRAPLLCSIRCERRNFNDFRSTRIDVQLYNVLNDLL